MGLKKSSRNPERKVHDCKRTSLEITLLRPLQMQWIVIGTWWEYSDYLRVFKFSSPLSSYSSIQPRFPISILFPYWGIREVQYLLPHLREQPWVGSSAFHQSSVRHILSDELEGWLWRWAYSAGIRGGLAKMKRVTIRGAMTMTLSEKKRSERVTMCRYVLSRVLNRLKKSIPSPKVRSMP